jgi:hypothetical protein
MVLESCAHYSSLKITHSEGVRQRWHHENAGELRQVRWVAYFRVPFFPGCRSLSEGTFASVSFWACLPAKAGKQKEMRISPDECNYLTDHHVKDSLQARLFLKLDNNNIPSTINNINFFIYGKKRFYQTNCSGNISCAFDQP